MLTLARPGTRTSVGAEIELLADEGSSPDQKSARLVAMEAGEGHHIPTVEPPTWRESTYGLGEVLYPGGALAIIGVHRAALCWGWIPLSS